MRQVNKYSSKKAQQELGVQGVNKLKREVSSAIDEGEEIRREVLDLAAVREKSAHRCLGLYTLCESESSDSESQDVFSNEPSFKYRNRLPGHCCTTYSI